MKDQISQIQMVTWGLFQQYRAAITDQEFVNNYLSAKHAINLALAQADEADLFDVLMLATRYLTMMIVHVGPHAWPPLFTLKQARKTMGDGWMLGMLVTDQGLAFDEKDETDRGVLFISLDGQVMIEVPDEED